MKTMFFLFIILTIINVPVIVVFVINKNGPEISSLFNAISFFTIGNIGESSYGCAYSTLEVYHYTKKCACLGTGCPLGKIQAGPKPDFGPGGVPVSRQKLVLQCPAGAKITQINEFGFLNPTGYSRKSPVDP